MSKRRCESNCKNFTSKLKDKEWREQNPGYIGICEKYGQKVRDTLCGCENKPGKTTLWNFGGIKA